MSFSITNISNAVEALVCVRPGELSLEVRRAPRRAEGEALVAVRRIGICGTDYHIFEGKHPFLNYPRVMGHELAVEVLEIGEDASIAPGTTCAVNPYISCGACIACRAGKPNCCTKISVLGVHQDGGMTPLLSLPAGNLVKADGLGIDACATIEFLAIGAHAVRRGAVSATDRVLVVGAGPIGLGVALFARIAGGQVTTIDRDADRLDIARTIAGSDTIVADDYSLASIAERTDGDGFDVVFDATGNAASMAAGFDFVAHGGRYVLVSVVKGPIAFEDADFHRKEMTVLGSRNATATDFDRVVSAIRDGLVPVSRLITHRTSLEGAVQSLPAWVHDKRGLIKAVIEIEPH